MAQVDEDLDLDVESDKKKGGGKMKSIIIFSVIGILIIGLSVALTLVLIGGDKEAAPGEAQQTEGEAAASKEKDDEAAAAAGESVAYLDLVPAFVVNLDGQESEVRYLQVTMSVMVEQEGDLEIVKTHMPVLRHHLNMLFSSLDFNDISDREGKNKLTDETLKVVRDALEEAAGKPVVKAIFFNSIVGQ